MTLNYEAATKRRDTYQQQAARFLSEADDYRKRAEASFSPEEKRSLLEAARTLDSQADEVRKMADTMQTKIADTHAGDKALTFEEKMMEARERGKKRGLGNDGLEIDQIKLFLRWVFITVTASTCLDIAVGTKSGDFVPLNRLAYPIALCHPLTGWACV